MKRAHYDIIDQPDTASRSSSHDFLDHVTSHVDGDRVRAMTRVVNVSKKVHACTECQRRKIKCDLVPGEAACSRCSKKGLQCIVNKNLQTLLEDDIQWKTRMENESRQLQTAVTEILRTLDLPALENFTSSIPQISPRHSYSSRSNAPDLREPILQRSPETIGEERRPSQAIGMAMTRENSQDRMGGDDLGNEAMVAAPMGSLYEVTKLRNLRSNPRGYFQHATVAPLEEDFISRGRISVEEAEELFEIFNHTLNQYLWGGIVLLHKDLESVRRSSSLLLAAILTVTALHIPGRSSTFDICYSEFFALVRDSMLDRYHTLDGIRGLCIGAFWLSDVSWKLSGHAVRIATELNLHQSYARAMRGSHEHFEGARLWYLLYVCDHHFSIAYGRPPVIQDDLSIVFHEKFLALPGTTQADLRLHSQIGIFIILTQIYNAFGPDIEQRLEEGDLPRLRGWNVDIDNWRVRWEPQLAPNPYISSYPSKGVSLHYHFAKLQLNSLSLRGLRPSQSSTSLSHANSLSPHSHSHSNSYPQTHTHQTTLSATRREHANLAISCAMSILRLVVNEPDIRDALIGVPLYLHTMITYAAVFLLKVQQQWKAVGLGTDGILIRDTVECVIGLLAGKRAGERHLAWHIAGGLGKMLGRMDSKEVLNGERGRVNEDGGGRSSDGNVRTGDEAGNGNGNGNGFAGLDDGFGLGANYGQMPLYGEPTRMFDEHYFPIGFFDVTTIGGPGQFSGGA